MASLILRATTRQRPSSFLMLLLAVILFATPSSAFLGPHSTIPSKLQAPKLSVRSASVDGNNQHVVTKSHSTPFLTATAAASIAPLLLLAIPAATLAYDG